MLNFFDFANATNILFIDPLYNFSIKLLSFKDAASIINDIEKTERIDLIVVPNKKKNVFARFFNPTLAHKILFHADIPMMTIPV